MQVELISKTAPVTPDLLGIKPGELLAHIARVSNPTNQHNHLTAPKLLRHCLINEHWSVFEHVHLTMKIVTSRAISAQILRHWGFRFQEFSQRYAEVTEFETYEARSQDLKNRQNSIDDLPHEVKTWFVDQQKHIQAMANSLYEQSLKKGIAKEQARMLLPVSSQTTIYVTGNIRGWITYCLSRCSPHAQKEHRDIALECRKILFQVCPELEEGYYVLEGKKRCWLTEIMTAQKSWSSQTFGTEDRTEGVLKHLESEISEVRDTDFGSDARKEEIADLMILVMDLAWRNGMSAADLKDAVDTKSARNYLRHYPKTPPDQPSFHQK